MKVKGGVYGSLCASVSAFHAAIMPMNHFSAWEKSQLFSPDDKKVIESYAPRAPGVEFSNSLLWSLYLLF